ncbi:RNA recognition domain-containing protein [Colletotrichum kahawae]|uniref:RNA recognition domain-containing protein n=1 Tax=Colletotrichum kahawae TaxID=34407 RepID=A0AAD9Y247_COLKA|nr:RNA recognition domain-containing protein [Colletotrichum kahawae]
MSGSTDNKKLLEQLQKLSFQHELEQASNAGSAASQMAEPVYGLLNPSISASKSPDFSSASSEDRDPERGGGVRLDASSLRGSPNSFARRSEAVGKALRPTMSATATLSVHAQKAPAQDDGDVFNDSSADDKPLGMSSAAYKLNQSHIQQAGFKGKDVIRRSYDEGSPTKPRSDSNKLVDPQATWPATACIFVANLPEHREDYTLEAAVTKEFQRFGVVFVKIRRDTNGMPFAFVQFTNDESANEARIEGKGTMILGRPCRTETVRANRTYIIYRRNRTAITVEEANELLTPFGDLETARFLDDEIQQQMRLPVTIRVQFKEFDSTQQVLKAFRLNRVYHVEAYDFKKAMQARSRNPERMWLDTYDRDRRSVFIGDLPLDFTESDIRILMEDVGSVVSVQVKRLDYHREGPKLIAFVEFTNPTVPEMAIERYHNNNIQGYYIRVERRTNQNRRGSNNPGRFQGNSFNGASPSNMGGRAPSTPAREQRGPLAIEAGSSFNQEAVQNTPVRQTPLRNEMHSGMAQTQNVMQPTVVQTPQRQNGIQVQHVQQMPAQAQQQVGPVMNQIPHQAQNFAAQQQVPAQVQVPVHGQMQSNMAPPMAASPMGHAPVAQMGTPMGPHPHQQHMGTPMGHHPHQQMGTSMGPPLVPQMNTPMMPQSGSYMGTPFSQGPFSQGPGSAYGFMTPQPSPGAPFWGYGHGTPLWTPFPVDPAAFMAFTSPVPPARSNGVAPAGPQLEANQVTQSEPVMTDSAQA